MPMPRTVSTGRTLLNTPTSYLDKLRSLFGAGSIVALWPQNEAAGTVSLDVSGHAYNGAYTGVTLGAAGIGDGNTAASFDGTTSFNNVYSAGVAGAFNGAEGSFLEWVKVSGIGVWTDATTRYIASFLVNGSNAVTIRKTTTDNQLNILYAAGGTTKQVNSTAAAGNINFFLVGITWSASGDAMKAYISGAQVGTTQTGLGVWAGAVAATTTTLGSQNTTPAAVWSGSFGPALLLNRAATAAEILQAATV